MVTHLTASSRAFRLALLVTTLLATGCNGFGKAWNQVPVNLPEDTIAGRWEGTWTSESSSHEGPLRCVITLLDDQHFEAHFEARYARLFKDRFRVQLAAERRTGATWHFLGKHDLGWLKGGVFSCQGSINPTKFFARYESKDDQGRFELARPGAPSNTSGQRRSPWAKREIQILLANAP